jgi:hypothetical protein
LLAEGEGDDLDLLRALCHTAWETGVTELGERAKAMLS